MEQRNGRRREQSFIPILFDQASICVCACIYFWSVSFSLYCLAFGDVSFTRKVFPSLNAPSLFAWVSLVKEEKEKGKKKRKHLTTPWMYSIWSALPNANNIHKTYQADKEKIYNSNNILHFYKNEVQTRKHRA